MPLHPALLHPEPLHPAPLHPVPLHPEPFHSVPLHPEPLHPVPLHLVPLHPEPSIQCPSIQCPSIQHSSPSTLRKALYIQCSSTQRLHPPPSTHIFIKASTRRVFPAKVLPPSHILGQRARFSRQSAPTVPDFGTEGAFSLSKCSHRPGFRDRRRSFGTEGAVGVSICATSGAVGVFRDSNTTFFPMGL